MTQEPGQRGDRRGGGWRPALWGPGGLLIAVALIATLFVGEPTWIDWLAQSGALLLGIGIAAELVARKRGRAAYRTAMIVGVGTAILLGWVNGAVGIIGSEDNRANLLYGIVVVVGVAGALIARMRPAGMSRALFATAAAQATVAAIAISGRLGGEASGAFELMAVNGFFVALFVASGLLFAKAAPSQPR